MSELGAITLTLEFRRDGRRWLGRCLELSTSTFARTLPQVQKELAELVELHLNVLEETGERERFIQMLMGEQKRAEKAERQAAHWRKMSDQNRALSERLHKQVINLVKQRNGLFTRIEDAEKAAREARG